MRADLDTEGLARLCVSHAGVATGADEARRAGGDSVAPLIEGEHGNLEAFAFPPDQIFARDLDLLHLEEAGIAGKNSPLLLERAARKSFERALDDEGAEAGRVALLLLIEIRPREHQKRVGDVGQRDPHLLAGQEIPIAPLDGHTSGCRARRCPADGSVSP